MDNKTILDAAQHNGDRGSEFEHKENVRASLMSAILTILVGVILFVMDFFMKNIVNGSLVILGVILYRGITYKQIWKIIVGATLSFVVLFMILAKAVM